MPISIEIERVAMHPADADRPTLFSQAISSTTTKGSAAAKRVAASSRSLYFARLAADGALEDLTMPMRIQDFGLQRASAEEAHWLAAMLNRESEGFGAGAEEADGGRLALRWS